MNDIYQQLPLGKQTAYCDQYDASLLVAVPRAQTRHFWPTDMALPFGGEDLWTGYELSWLNSKGKPQVACTLIRYNALSPHIIESKSLKLYMNSFNQTTFDSDERVREIMQQDLSACTGADVSVQLLPVQGVATLAAQDGDVVCIDELDIAITQYQPDAHLLQTDDNSTATETLCSHLLRSNCPVTGQPDWASVRIHYTGRKILHESLLRYLCSFRLHQGFHEQCIEQIFCDIWRHCQPDMLGVEGRFTRRGGLDINPFRASHAELRASEQRSARQ